MPNILFSVLRAVLVLQPVVLKPADVASVGRLPGPHQPRYTVSPQPTFPSSSLARECCRIVADISHQSLVLNTNEHIVVFFIFISLLTDSVAAVDDFTGRCTTIS